MMRRSYFRLAPIEWGLVVGFAVLGVVTGHVARAIPPLTDFVKTLPGEGQWLAGFHVVWLVVAVGLMRRVGLATLVGLLMGLCEYAIGNQHGLSVLMLSVSAGLIVDLAWLWHRNRGPVIGTLLAGGFGSGMNVFVQAVCMPHSCVCGSSVAISLAAGAAFFSGVLIGGGVALLAIQAFRGLGVPRTPAVVAKEPIITD